MKIDNKDIAWCPGCGNFAIRNIIKKAIEELEIDPNKVVFVSGIGQAAKMPQYLEYHFFNGLHGRALPTAFGIKASNNDLLVIAEGGDGDMYGEGGNHFLHTIRRNIDIVHIVHNNMIYGLTKGQASPTTEVGTKTSLQLDGVAINPVNPISLAISQRASFVARSFCLDNSESVDIFKKAINHKGYALIDMLHQCISFNKINDNKWFKEHTYYLEDEYDKNNIVEAFKISQESDKMALGIIYQEEKKTYLEKVNIYKEDKNPLYLRKSKNTKLYDKLTEVRK